MHMAATATTRAVARNRQQRRSDVCLASTRWRHASRVAARGVHHGTNGTRGSRWRTLPYAFDAHTREHVHCHSSSRLSPFLPHLRQTATRGHARWFAYNARDAHMPRARLAWLRIAHVNGVCGATPHCRAAYALRGAASDAPAGMLPWRGSSWRRRGAWITRTRNQATPCWRGGNGKRAVATTSVPHMTAPRASPCSVLHGKRQRCCGCGANVRRA